MTILKQVSSSKYFHKQWIFILTCTILIINFQPTFALPSGKTQLFLPTLHQTPHLVISPLRLYSTTQYLSATIGEVQNMSISTAFSVTLQVELYDESTQNTFTTLIKPQLPVVFPQSASPFYIPHEVVEKVRVVRVYSADEVSSTEYVPLVATLTRLDCVTGRHGNISGSVQNNKETSVNAVYISVWSLKDDASEGVSQAVVTQSLQPGEEAAFTTTGIPFCGPTGVFSGVTTDDFVVVAAGKIE